MMMLYLALMAATQPLRIQTHIPIILMTMMMEIMIMIMMEMIANIHHEALMEIRVLIPVPTPIGSL